MRDWSFLHPWLLVGLAGVSIPIIIHLIGRRRAPTVSFAAFDFLLAINKRLARRERLRQLLLLILRILALASLALALARPLPAQQTHTTPTQRRLALIVDTSASMAFVWQGKTLAELAKEVCHDLLGALNPGDRVVLVFSGHELTSPFSAPTVDIAALKAAIDAAPTPAGTADLGAAIEQALALWGPDAAGSTLTLVTDLSANSFSAIRPTPLDPPPEVRLVDAAGRTSPTALANTAITRVQVLPAEQDALARRVAVELRNFGSQADNGRTLELVIDGQVTQKSYVDLPAGESTTRTLTQRFDSPGHYAGRVRLTPTDGFATDDEALVLANIAKGVRLLLINGDPRTTPYEDELFFAGHALAAVPAGEPALNVRTTTLDEWISTGLQAGMDDTDVVLLANIGTLPAPLVAELESFVRQGGGLIFSAGDRIQFEAFNEAFASLLPHPLRDRQRVADPNQGTPPIGISEGDWEHPVLAGIEGEAALSLKSSRTSLYFNVDAGAEIRAHTLLRFDNGAPALLERNLGKGRVLFFATTLDVDWSDLAIRSAFPALLQQWVRYAADAEATPANNTTVVGSNFEMKVPAGIHEARLTAPDGSEQLFQVTQATRRLRVGPFDHTGVYLANLRSEDWRRAPAYDLIVNPSLTESDFTPVNPSRLAEALGGADDGRDIRVAMGSTDGTSLFEQRGYATYLLLLLALFFIGENLLAARG